MAHKRKASVVTCEDFPNVNIKLYFAELVVGSSDNFVMKEIVK